MKPLVRITTLLQFKLINSQYTPKALPIQQLTRSLKMDDILNTNNLNTIPPQFTAKKKKPQLITYNIPGLKMWVTTM